MTAGRLPNSAEVKMWQLGGACDAAPVTVCVLQVMSMTSGFAMTAI